MEEQAACKKAWASLYLTLIIGRTDTVVHMPLRTRLSCYENWLINLEGWKCISCSGERFWHGDRHTYQDKVCVFSDCVRGLAWSINIAD